MRRLLDALKRLRGGPAEKFDFKEEVRVTPAPLPSRVPRPRTAIVEVCAPDGTVLVMDTLEVPRPAPRGPVRIGPRPSTFIMHPHGPRDYCFQSFDCAFHDCPFPLPKHLLKKGASHLRVLWSCDE